MHKQNSLRIKKSFDHSFVGQRSFWNRLWAVSLLHVVLSVALLLEDLKSMFAQLNQCFPFQSHLEVFITGHLSYLK